MALYAVSFLSRRGYAALTGSRWAIAFVLTLAGVVLLGISGWPEARPTHSERAAAS
jgi:hypothetical protein